MKIQCRPYLVAALLFVAVLTSVRAQPPAFTYQGQLSDNGAPASGSYDLQFTMYDSSDGAGIVAGPITNSPTHVSNGLFTVTLDFGAGVFDGSDLWLEIGAATNGGGPFSILTPRQPITSTPYAIKAANARTVDMGTISNPSFIGTTTDSPLDLFVNNQRALRLQPDSVSPTLVGGNASNSVTVTSFGSVIAGGGSAGRANAIGENSMYSVIGGGQDNVILSSASHAVIAGGETNSIGALASLSVIGGGLDNHIDTGSLAGVIAGGSVNHIGSGSWSAAISGGTGNEIGAESFWSFVGGGRNNTIGGSTFHGAIAGGSGNTLGLNADSSAIGGGAGNTISDGATGATIAGGQENTAGSGSHFSTIGGGVDNQVWDGAPYSTIVGGRSSKIRDAAEDGVIGGGVGHLIDSNATAVTIAGGSINAVGVNADYSTIGGGIGNAIGVDARSAVIPGGRENGVGAGASYAFAAGRRAKANHQGTFVWADSTDADFTSTTNNQFLIRATGGVGIGTAAPGAHLEVAGANFLGSAIRHRNSSSGNTTAWDVGQRVISSSDNYLSFEHNATLALALRNSGQVGIGTTAPEGDLHIHGNSTTGSMVITPNAGNSRSQILLAENTSASLGMILRYAGNEAANPLHFIGWNSDVEGSPLLTIERNGGDVGIGTSNPTEDLHVVGNILATGTITPSSDRNLKKNFDSVDAQEVLERVTSLPIQQWTYRAEEDSVRHVGPMAQDFHAAFGLGANDTTIATVDADGVALAAIQGLNEKLEALERTVQHRDTENAELKWRIEKLERLLNTQFREGEERMNRL